MLFNIERLIHSFKTALGCLVGFALTKALHAYLIFDQWLIVTILVVMCAQLSVGSIVYKSSIRFIGTCIGSLLAAFSIHYFGNAALSSALVIALAGFIFSYLATGEQSFADAGTLGAVTTAIILINPDPSLALTVERFIEISLGLIIATLISQFIFPIHAGNHLKRHQADALRLLGSFYKENLIQPHEDKKECANLDERIVLSLMTQRKLAKEAKRELLGSQFEPERFNQIMDYEKKILRVIDFMGQLYRESKLQPFLKTQAAWNAFNLKMAACFDQLALFAGNPLTSKNDFSSPSVEALEKELALQIDLNKTGSQPIFALFFCLTQLKTLIKGLEQVI